MAFPSGIREAEESAGSSLLDKFECWVLDVAEKMPEYLRHLTGGAFVLLVVAVADALGIGAYIVFEVVSLLTLLYAMIAGVWPGLSLFVVGSVSAHFLLLSIEQRFSFSPDVTPIMLGYYLSSVPACLVAGRFYRMRRRLTSAMARAETLIGERNAAFDAKRQIGQELDRLLEIAPVAVLLAKDQSCDVIVGNPASEVLMEVPASWNNSLQGGNAESVPYRIVDDNGDELPVRELPVQRAAHGEVLQGKEFNLRFVDGRIKRVSASAAPIRDGEAGAICGAVAVLMDVSAHYEFERTLIQAKQDAERANEAKSRFLAAASHDLRQPLQALNLYLDVLTARSGPSERSLIANININKCSTSLNSLLTDLLDLSKLEAGVVRPHQTIFSLAELLDMVAAAHAAQASLKGLRLRVVPSKVMLKTDRALFERVVGNLISNAVRYTDQGGVLVGCRRRSGKLWLDVCDTGIGIPEGKTSEIFEEFRQLGNPERDREKGTGLGLAIVRKAATLLGLEISLSSKLGRGSIFSISLPFAGVEAVHEGVRDDGCFIPFRALRVLLVEDDLAVREALTFIMETDGNKVVTKGSLAEVAHGDYPKPDVVIADYRLGEGRNGVEAVSTVRAIFGDDVPAIILTGDTLSEVVEEIVALGFTVLHKPVSYAMLRTCLATFRDYSGGF
jgi:signal transduction histidine kinase